MADLRARRKEQDKAKFVARKDELESLRDRIKAMADEQDVDLEKPWTPEMMSADVAAKPEVSKLAKLLGDDSGDSEYDVTDEELDAEYDDPLDKFPIWIQLYEEAKLVTWPTPGKVASTTLLVYAGMLGSAILVLGLDTAAITAGQKIGFVYGKNPNAVKSRFKLPAIFDPGAANQVEDPSPFPKADE